MSELEKEELETRIKGMTKEEQMVTLNAIPIEIVLEHVTKKVSTLNSELEKHFRYTLEYMSRQNLNLIHSLAVQNQLSSTLGFQNAKEFDIKLM